MTSDIYGNYVRTLLTEKNNIAKPRALAAYESREWRAEDLCGEWM